MSKSTPELPKVPWNTLLLNAGVSGMAFPLNDYSVVKRFYGGEERIKDLMVERSICKRLGEHPRIAKYLYSRERAIIFERLMYPLCVPIFILQHKGATPTPEETMRWSAQAAEGTYEKEVFQADISLNNLLLEWDDNVKYCDFSSSWIDENKPSVTVSGQAEHPDLDNSGVPTVQSELFALGPIIYQISTTHKAYAGIDEDDQKGRYARGAIPETDHLLLKSVILGYWKGTYQSAREIAAEIKTIQRNLMLGEYLDKPIYDFVQHKKALITCQDQLRYRSATMSIFLFEIGQYLGPIAPQPYTRTQYKAYTYPIKLQVQLQEYPRYLSKGETKTSKSPVRYTRP
ncbi:hypothetical protein M501DRAFT_1057071 [Patellaria atrata CBS 101060]|uniref:Protein kinase domain-containing protein n=1 Tax=Patellaria atrata CBS 101060 TaxID=1346257 RepID=A0A9P4SDF8_9PEZI|nr:hypothetical protein M501DRAFT_1057071 [Patellaria atrata CBS 101060]